MTEELPDGWARAKIGELGRYTNGRGFKKSEWSDEGLPIIRIQNLTGSSGKFNYFSGELDERHVVEEGDLLLSWAATLGVFEWPGPRAALNQHIFKVESYIDKKFHRFLLEGLIEDMYRKSHGSGMVHVTRGKFESLEVDIPPRAEQRRIVESLEVELPRLYNASSLVNRSHIRASSLIERFADFQLGLHEGGDVRPLGELLREPLRNGHSARSVSGGGVRTLTLTAVTKESFSDEHTKLTCADPGKVSDLWLKSGDILIQRSNAIDLVGSSAIYRGDDDWAIFPDLLIRVRLADFMDPGFVLKVLQSSKVRTYFRKSAKGLSGSMPKIDQGTIRDVMVPIPSLAEQRAVVAAIDSYESRVKYIFRALGSAEEKAEDLRQSLLATAFSGKLVAQDPTEDPASVILERIRVDRDSGAKAKRGGKAQIAKSPVRSPYNPNPVPAGEQTALEF